MGCRASFYGFSVLQSVVQTRELLRETEAGTFCMHASNGRGSLGTAEYQCDDLEYTCFEGSSSIVPETRVYRHRAADEAGVSVAGDDNKSS